MSTQMSANTISGEAKRCLKAGEFTNFQFERYEDGAVAVFSKTRRFLALFAHFAAAEKAVTGAMDRAIKAQWRQA